MKSTVAFVLTLIGGILQILGGIWMFIAGATVLTILPAFLTSLGIGLAIVYLVVGILSVWASTMMNKDDNAKVKKGGIIAIITGIVGFNILVIIGAIIALVKSSK